MKKLMFAINNFFNIAESGYKAIINRNQDLIIGKVIFIENFDKDSSYYYDRKKTNNRIKSNNRRK